MTYVVWFLMIHTSLFVAENPDTGKRQPSGYHTLPINVYFDAKECNKHIAEFEAKISEDPKGWVACVPHSVAVKEARDP
jgi:hypothetical protein